MEFNREFIDAEQDYLSLVSPRRRKKVNALYDLLQQSAPDLFKLFQPFRPSLGLLEKKLFQSVLDKAELLRMCEEQQSDQITEVRNALCLQFVLVFFEKVRCYFAQFVSNPEALELHQPSAEEKRWLTRFCLAYIFVSHDTDSAIWDETATEGGKSYRIIFNIAFLQCYQKLGHVPYS